MAEESEKRFYAVMDKLFHAPPKVKSKSTTPTPTTRIKAVTSSSSMSGAEPLRCMKHTNPGYALSVLKPKSNWDVAERLKITLPSGGSLQAPLCRPWDRGDLFRRLATFKSMTWFGKPQAVSAVNCARRGWVNVDTDTIACEACGTRLLFSTPSSWTQLQVEKAASVFSLKLDNGHKLLCPWIDNSCDEMLAEFPPSPAAVLVDEYKKRSSALMQLLALPVLSLSAIDYMKSPLLEHYLSGAPTVGCENKSNPASQMECGIDQCQSASSVSYYQALKLISLCGWEPRLLPYIVVSKDREHQDTKQADLLDVSYKDFVGENHSFTVYTSAISEGTEAAGLRIDSKYDPNSVVLECRLCGATVGLWAFSTVALPVEFVRLVGFSEVNGDDCSVYQHENVTCSDPGIENHVERGESVTDAATTGATSSNDRLQFTIAGGPPPAKQNFRAIISLPLIGHNLRARLSSDSDFRDCSSVEESFMENKNHKTVCLTEQGPQAEEVSFVQDKNLDDGNPMDSNKEQLPFVNNDIIEQHDTSENEKRVLQSLNNGIIAEKDAFGNTNNFHMDVAGEDASREGPPDVERPDYSTEDPIESTLNLVESSSSLEKMQVNAENVEILKSGVETSPQLHSESINIHVVDTTIENGDTSMNDRLLSCTVDSFHLEDIPADMVCSTKVSSEDSRQLNRGEQPVHADVSFPDGKNPKQLQIKKATGFDPIRQHRHFCPWIASTGNAAPGWQQTITALQRQKEFSYPSSEEAHTSSLIEVDNPVATVKKLLTPPSAKRAKLTHGMN